jgi:hypothetical protein
MLKSKKFLNKNELLILFNEASRYCLMKGRRICLNHLPEKLLYYFPDQNNKCDYDVENNIKRVPVSSIKTFEEAIPILFREDGYYRPFIGLYPEGVTDSATIIQVVWDSFRFGNWINLPVTANPLIKLLKKLIKDYDPIIVRGPNLPANWKMGEPIPKKFSLPSYQFLSDDFDWSISIQECSGLKEKDPILRFKTLDNIYKKVANGFNLKNASTKVYSAAMTETDSAIKLKYLSLFRLFSNQEIITLIKEWGANESIDIRVKVYEVLSNKNTDDVFNYLIQRLKIELVEAQRALIASLNPVISNSSKRHETFLNTISQLRLSEDALKVVNIINTRFKLNRSIYGN